MGGYDDELTRPLEGAIEATTSEGPTSPAVGRDEWVARHGDNRSQRGGPLGAIEDRLRRVPWWAWLTLFVAAACLVPVVSDNGYVRRVAFDITIYMLLALGLNVVVGWGGLLDLGLRRVLRDRRLRVCAPELRPLRHPPAHDRGDPDRRRDRRCRRLPGGAAIAQADR